MKAIKDNKVYTVDETTKGPYLARGFDITDDEGNVTLFNTMKVVRNKAHGVPTPEL